MISPSLNCCLIGCPRETLRASLECGFMQKKQPGRASKSPYGMTMVTAIVEKKKEKQV